jgi:hypothetical protein
MVLRRLAVLNLAQNKLPSSVAPDPRRELDVFAAEDTYLVIDLVDDGMTPVHYKVGQTLQLTVRPTPTVDDEKLIRLNGVPQPKEGPNVWLFTFSADFTRRKATQFTRAFYDLLLIEAGPPEKRSLVVRASLFRILGSPAAP